MRTDKPNFKAAMTNIKNVFRMAVGLPKAYPVKVVRTEDAKEYPLISISKAGDVGYNLASVANVTIPAPTPEQRGKYLHNKIKAKRYAEIGNMKWAEDYEKKALDCLPKAMIPTGVKLEMLNTVWCSIEARSSSSSKLLITPDAIIDAGYRGELFGVIYNFGYEPYHVTKGEMLIQIIFHERIIAQPKEVSKLGKSQRGETGFGSTGSIAKKED